MSFILDQKIYYRTVLSRWKIKTKEQQQNGAAKCNWNFLYKNNNGNLKKTIDCK